MNAKQLNILIKIRQSWSDESKFCQDTMARDSNGRICMPTYHGAVCWCFRGLLMLHGVETSSERNTYDIIMFKSAEALFPELAVYPEASTMNDIFGYSKMIQILDHAITYG